MFESIDFSPGIIKYNEYNIDENALLNADNDELQEDMFFVVFPNNLAIDVGWYIGIKSFIVYVVKDYNWEEPIIRFECTTFRELKAKVIELTNWIKGSQ